jgi:hypothetical protein
VGGLSGMALMMRILARFVVLQLTVMRQRAAMPNVTGRARNEWNIPKQNILIKVLRRQCGGEVEGLSTGCDLRGLVEARRLPNLVVNGCSALPAIS